MSRTSSLPRTFLVAAFTVASFVAGGSADAQPSACEVIPGLCQLVMSCDPDNQIPKCTSTGCTCVTLCNANRDCPNMQDCTDGKCQRAAEACSLDSDCRDGKVCGARGTCEAAPPPGPCTSDAACDDHNPCNGRETCDGRDCRPGVPPSCDDGNAFTTDSCWIVDRAQNTYGCQSTGPSPCSVSGIRLPTIRFAGAKPGTKGRRFVWTGTLETRMSIAPPYDLPNSSVRVIVADQAGRSLVDAVIKGVPGGSPAGGGWTKDPKGGWTYRDPNPNAPVSRATFRDPTPKNFGRPFEIEGVMSRDTLGRTGPSRLAGGLIVDWTGDISGPCGVVSVPLCGPREMMGETWTVCREGRLR